MNHLTSSSYKVKAEEVKARDGTINLVGYARRRSDGADHHQQYGVAGLHFSKTHARTQTENPIFDKAVENLAFQSEEDDSVRIVMNTDQKGAIDKWISDSGNNNNNNNNNSNNNNENDYKTSQQSGRPINGNDSIHFRNGNISIVTTAGNLYGHGDDDSGMGNNSPSWAKERIRKCCSRKVLYKRVPALNYWNTYTSDMIISDLIAGVTVGLTMIPQAIAYSNVAGIPPEYGLFSAFMACFMYAFLGSCKVSSIGPTAIQAILVRENIHGLGRDFAVLLCLLTGIVQLVMGVLQLGFLLDFISGPVSVGFTSAAAIIIATTQLKDLLGLNYPATKFLDVWDELVEHINETKMWDFTFGLSCMIVLILLRKIKDIHIGPADTKDKKNIHKVIASLFWFISTGRNILVVGLCAIVTYFFNPPIALSGVVEPGLPEIEPPPFSSTVGNHTYSFFDMTSNLGSGIIILPLLSLLEVISGAKVFADGKPIDATQELLALGACNVVSSFAGSMSLSGALSRAAVNNASGVKTTFGSIYAGIVILISLQYFSPYFHYIPKASLAAVIIAAVVFMVEFHVVKPMWRTKKVDLIPAAATFLCCLFIKLEYGIFIGVGVNVLFLLYASARPTVHVQKHKSEWGYEYIVITPDRSLAFPSVEYVRNVVSKVGVKQGYSSIPVVIDSRHVQGADFTAAKGIKSLIDDFLKRNQPLLFYNLKPSVVEIFQGVQPTEFIYCQTEQELHDILKGYHFQLGNNVPKERTGR